MTMKNEHTVPFTHSDAVTLLAQTLHKTAYPASYLSELVTFLNLSWSSRPLTSTQKRNINTILADLNAQKPVEYIVGRALFYERYFFVSPAVLIPRIDTEQLLRQVISKKPEQATIIDIGTGSGALIITLARECSPTNQYIAIDISQPALDVARQNAQQYLVENQIRFICSNTIPTEGNGPLLPATESVFIVTNPPYISDQDMLTLPPSVKEYEPDIALREQPQFLIKLQQYIAFLYSHHKTVTLALEYSDTAGKMIQRIVTNPMGDLRELRLP